MATQHGKSIYILVAENKNSILLTTRAFHLNELWNLIDFLSG